MSERMIEEILQTGSEEDVRRAFEEYEKEKENDNSAESIS